jgi:hypothetical protein
MPLQAKLYIRVPTMALTDLEISTFMETAAPTRPTTIQSKSMRSAASRCFTGGFEFIPSSDLSLCS